MSLKGRIKFFSPIIVHYFLTIKTITSSNVLFRIWSWWRNKRLQRKTKHYKLRLLFCTAIQVKSVHQIRSTSIKRPNIKIFSRTFTPLHLKDDLHITISDGSSFSGKNNSFHIHDLVLIYTSFIHTYLCNDLLCWNAKALYNVFQYVPKPAVTCCL
jgi:hypothetical protein